ncbi:helix-turn-helix transcriptional regulator [Enterobacter asburiae]|uniref:helix-turn-helix transcriptional regulator n=1 Tax=Enterobacter asburiae TaxID=61645 RepID=UPI003896D9C6
MSLENKTRNVVLFEPRLLFRNIVKHHFDESGHSVVCASWHFLTEEGCHLYEDNPLIVIGIAGSGTEFRNAIRLIHHLVTRNYEIAVWVPQDERLIIQLMLGLGICHVLAEEHLSDELPKLSQHPHVLTPKAQFIACNRQIKRLSPTELNVLMDAARGMSMKQIATFRHNSYKTICSHKHNVCERLGLVNGAEWLELLAKIEQMNTQYI